MRSWFRAAYCRPSPAQVLRGEQCEPPVDPSTVGASSVRDRLGHSIAQPHNWCVPEDGEFLRKPYAEVQGQGTDSARATVRGSVRWGPTLGRAG